MKKPSPIEKEYETKDEFYEEDKAFFEAHAILLSGVGDLEKAAAIVTEYALNTGDQLALAFFLARLADFLEAGKLPPAPMRKGFRDVLKMSQNKNSEGKNGRPKTSLVDREWARTNANMVVHYHVNHGDSLEVAKEKTVEWRAASLRRKTGSPDLSAPKASYSKIDRDFKKYCKFKK